MKAIDRWVRRLRTFFRSETVERELDEELRLHVQMEAEDLVRSGMDPARAQREALVRFGGMERTKERVRDARGGRLLADLEQDLRYGARSLRRSPGFTASALLVLALGIGSATALFGVVDAVLLEPLPYPDAGRLVRVWPASPSRGVERAGLAYPDFHDWRERATTLDGLAAYSDLAADYAYRGGETPTELSSVWVAGDFFEVLGVAPVAGRALRAEDLEAERLTAVLSHGAWQRLFGGDPSVVGRTISLDYRSFEVVGIMPPGFSFPGEGAELWVPLSAIPQQSIPWELRQVRFLGAIGRLAPGVAPEAAREELSRITASLEETHPEANAGITEATVTGLREWIVGDVRSALWVVLGAVGFILLLACANVANLLLARGTGRARELALRVSLGAPATRVIRQLLTESALLAALGGALGMALAWLGTRALVLYGADFLPRATSVDLDGNVIATALGVTLAAATLAGVLPALRAADVAPADDLRDGGRGVGGARSGVRLRRALVGAEVALAVLLLTGAGLLVRSLGAMSGVDAGFEPAGRIAMTLKISQEKYAERAEWLAVYHTILERMQAHPDVVEAGAIRYLPFRSAGEAAPVRVPGLYEPEPEEQRYAETFQVSEGLFDALGIRVLRGRGIRSTDGADAPIVVVVNETFQREFFRQEDPVGRRLLWTDVPVEVVGVVADVRHGGLVEAPAPTMYVSNDQVARIQMSYVARTAGDPLALADDLRAIVRDIDPEQTISEIVALEQLYAEDLARPRFFTSLLAGFALLALVLAALGVYGVLAYVVRSRAREVGLRLALGASGERVAGEILLQGMAPVAVGLAVGLAGAAALTRFLGSLLFEVQPLDLVTYAGATLLLAAVAALACLLPAWTAARVDPMVGLRAE